MFTPEELAEMAAADAEIEAEFQLTMDDLKLSQEMDREAKRDAMDCKQRAKADREKAYREANREKYLACCRAYDKTHREQRRAHNKAYYETHREQRCAYMKAYREEHKEQLKAYREAHREQARAYQKAYYEAHKEEIKANRESRK